MFPDICFVSSDKIEQFPDRHVWIDSNLHHLAANVKIKIRKYIRNKFLYWLFTLVCSGAIMEKSVRYWGRADVLCGGKERHHGGFIGEPE